MCQLAAGYSINREPLKKNVASSIQHPTTQWHTAVCHSWRRRCDLISLLTSPVQASLVCSCCSSSLFGRTPPIRCTSMAHSVCRCSGSCCRFTSTALVVGQQIVATHALYARRTANVVDQLDLACIPEQLHILDNKVVLDLNLHPLHTNLQLDFFCGGTKKCQGKPRGVEEK